MSDEADLSVVYSGKVDAVLADADGSQAPVSLDVLYDLAIEAGVDEGSTVLDVGCATGSRSRELIRRTGCSVAGIELLPQLIDWGRDQTAAEGLTAQLTIEQGSILDLPAADAAYDVLWCTDVFGIIADLQGAVDECARVLRPNGHLISYITVATDRMAPFEQAELDRSQGCVGSSMNQQNLERCFAERFTIERKIIVGAQHRQSVIEAGDDGTLQNLLRASRLMTWPDRYRQTHGDAAYDAALTEAFWGVYQLLGKLLPSVYLLKLKASPEALPHEA